MLFFIIIENVIIEKLMTQKIGRSKNELHDNIFCQHPHTHTHTHTHTYTHTHTHIQKHIPHSNLCCELNQDLPHPKKVCLQRTGYYCGLCQVWTEVVSPLVEALVLRA